MTTVPFTPEPFEPSEQAESVVAQPSPAVAALAPLNVIEPPPEAVVVYGPDGPEPTTTEDQ